MLYPSRKARFVETVRPSASLWKRAAAAFVGLQVLAGAGEAHAAAHAEAIVPATAGSSTPIRSVLCRGNLLLSPRDLVLVWGNQSTLSVATSNTSNNSVVAVASLSNKNWSL